MAEIDQQNHQQVIRKRRFLQRGESMVASAGLAVAAILLAAMGINAWWVSRTYRQSFDTVQATEIRAIGELLADTSKSLLEAGELTALRRLIADTSRKYQLETCRLVLPNGEPIADAEPSKISVVTLPETWPGQTTSSGLESLNADGRVELVHALNISGRGWVRLEVSMTLAESPRGYLDLQAGGGIVGAFTLLALLLVYRHMRSKLTALGAIREALLAYESGVTNEAALLINSDFGAEAVAWNQLLMNKQEMNKQLIEEKAGQLLGSRRENRTDLMSACDAMKHGLILIDGTMKTKYMNGAAAILLQTTREESGEADISTYLEEPQVLEMLKAAVRGQIRCWTSHEVEFTETSHTSVIRFSVRPVRQDDSASAIIIIEDLTQQRVADDARQSFVAQATHELRMPLTNIRLYVETALEEGENDPVIRAKCLNVINQESRRLERIVGDMLSVSEIEAGSIQLKEGDVRLESLFEQLELDYQALAKEKNVSLSFNLPPKFPLLRGDRDKIVLAMHNLLGNALKYTSANGAVAIDVNTDENNLIFIVSDTGIGIDEEDVDLIFDKFYRAKNTRGSDFAGSGLGLALAREVVRLHGGDITVNSEINRGSKFTLTLPLTSKAA